MHKIENIHKTQIFSLGKPYRRKPRKLAQNSSITKTISHDEKLKYKKSHTTLFLSPPYYSLSPHANLSECVYK